MKTLSQRIIDAAHHAQTGGNVTGADDHDRALADAAPEMLSALRDCSRALSRFANSDNEYSQICIRRANAAILKATAESHTALLGAFENAL